jgi:hypothetical protein
VSFGSRVLIRSLYGPSEYPTAERDRPSGSRERQPSAGACEAAAAHALEVINSGYFALASDWRANFRADNHNSPENILVVKFLNEPGLGFEMFYRPLHYHQLSPAPWNGFATLAETYYAFDTLRIETVPVPGTNRTSNLLVSNDRRHDIFLVGLQRNLETGELVNDRPGNPLFFTPEIRDATAHDPEPLWA